MKICFAVCEYNPFHNGHLKHLDIIRREIKPDAIVIIMSGNFTQRGEVAVLDKYTRAEHAIKAGADMVIELPAAFAVAPAEIFAQGAIKLINSVHGDKVLCFGTESAEKAKLLSTAKALLNETKEFKSLLKEELRGGVSYIKAKVNALKKMNIDGFDFELLNSPNNILAIEYAKAVISSKSDIELYPILRDGSDYNDTKLTKSPSALAVRTAINDGQLRKVKAAVPKFVYETLPKTLPCGDDIILYKALSTAKSDLRKITDCSEGLENRIKALAKTSLTLGELKDKLKTKRYTFSRISRILLSNLLETDDAFIRRCLKNKLYLRVLAVRKGNAEILPYISKNSEYEVITRRSDAADLSGVAEECLKKDLYANEIYKIIAKKNIGDFEIKII